MKKAIVICALTLGGCATKPDYEIISPAQYTQQDKKQHFYECKLQARSVMPGVTPNFPAMGGLASGMATAAGQSRVHYDTALMRECLEAKGYQFVNKK